MDNALPRRAPRVLVVHFSQSGQTTKIARRIAATLRDSGLEATLAEGAYPGIAHEIAAHDAVVIGAAVRYGRHARQAEELVRRHASRLSALPCALFSVSLSAAGNEKQRGDAQRVLEEFLARTGWSPRHTATIAGALRYRRYGLFLRWMMRFMAKRAGHATDVSRDYEYTDWGAVDRFARRVANGVWLPPENHHHHGESHDVGNGDVPSVLQP
jgi:menaquinone-dependent protoporphyrinogen oxidase